MEPKSKKIYKSLKEIASTAQIHGIPKIINSDHIVIKIMWLFFTIGSVSVCFWVLVKTIRDYLEYPVVTNINQISEIPSAFPAVTICSLNPTEKKYSINDRIVKCTFDDIIDCSNYFVDFNTDLLNSCMKLNMNSQILRIARPGIAGGLVVTIFDGLFNESRTDPLNVGSNGLQVRIHNNSDLSDSLTGTIVMPGVSTYLKIQKIIKSKLSEPYNQCIDTLETYHSFDSTLYKAMIDLNYTYKQKNCLDFAFLRSISSNISIDNLYDLKSLNQSISSIFFGFKNFYTNDTFKKYLSVCPLECNSITYETSAFQSSYPSFNEYLNLLNNKSLISKFPNGNLTKIDELKQSLYKVYIYFENLEYTEISEQAQISLWNFISSVGGLLGLFLGVSLLSFVDLFQITLELVFIIFEKNKVSTSLKNILDN